MYTCGNSSLLPVAPKRWIFSSPVELLAVELSTQLGGQGGDDGPHHASIQRHTTKTYLQPTGMQTFLIRHYQFSPVAFQLSERAALKESQKVTWQVGTWSGGEQAITSGTKK